MIQQTICVATVGTGTAGDHSMVAYGILYGIRQTDADRVYLVPSTSPESRETADYVAAEAAVAQWEDNNPYRVFTDCDNLLQCRNEMREILREVKRRHPGARIILNPTSGTKQMTTGAYLAGVEAQVSRIDYVVGERVDGVVKTGSEKLISVSGREIAAEMSARQAVQLIKAGAYTGALRLLRPYSDLFPGLISYIVMVESWHRFAYAQALEQAEKSSSAACSVLKKLDSARRPSLIHAADMIAFVDREIRCCHPEEALAVLYRLVELLAKIRMSELGVNVHRMDLQQIEEKLCPPKAVHDELLARRNNDDRLLLGLRLSLQVLSADHGPLYTKIFKNPRNWRPLQERNETRYGHGNQAVPIEAVRDLRENIVKIACSQWSELPKLINSCRFPEIPKMKKKEEKHA